MTIAVNASEFFTQDLEDFNNTGNSNGNGNNGDSTSGVIDAATAVTVKKTTIVEEQPKPPVENVEPPKEEAKEPKETENSAPPISSEKKTTGKKREQKANNGASKKENGTMTVPPAAPPAPNGNLTALLNQVYTQLEQLGLKHYRQQYEFYVCKRYAVEVMEQLMEHQIKEQIGLLYQCKRKEKHDQFVEILKQQKKAA